MSRNLLRRLALGGTAVLGLVALWHVGTWGRWQHPAVPGDPAFGPAWPEDPAERWTAWTQGAHPQTPEYVAIQGDRLFAGWGMIPASTQVLAERCEVVLEGEDLRLRARRWIWSPPQELQMGIVTSCAPRLPDGWEGARWLVTERFGRQPLSAVPRQPEGWHGWGI